MLSINGGYFVNKPLSAGERPGTLYHGDDRDGRAFQVPVNKGWSEGYEACFMCPADACAAQHHYRKDRCPHPRPTALQATYHIWNR